VTNLSITFTTAETFANRAPQFVCEMHPQGWDEDEPALILTVTDFN
jgi:hypothetical protein